MIGQEFDELIVAVALFSSVALANAPSGEIEAVPGQSHCLNDR